MRIKGFVLFGVIALLGCPCPVPAQSYCTVLMADISISYEGDCKNRLAHGQGKATGADSYEGNFKKGWPNGFGVYTWKNGDHFEGNWQLGKREGEGKMTFVRSAGDSVLTGFWRDDIYVGEIAYSYKVGMKRNITRERFMLMADTPPRIGINISPLSGGRVENLQLLNETQAYTELSSTFNGFSEVEYPFKGVVTFESVKVQNTQAGQVERRLNCRFEFEIQQAGRWEVTIIPF